MTPGTGRLKPTWIGSKKEVTEAVNTAFNYLKSNSNIISSQINTKNNDYLMQLQDVNNIGMTEELSLATLIGLCSVALNKPVIQATAILGTISIGGTINKIPNLSNTLQVCLDSGAKKVLIPMNSSTDFTSVPPELMSKFNIIFYNTPEDAVFKALGVE